VGSNQAQPGKSGASISDEANMPKHLQHPASKICCRFSSVHAQDTAISSSPLWRYCFWSQPWPGRAEATTKIANKPFSEAFSDAWVWCDFWARDQGLAFSIRHCSTALARLGCTREPGSSKASRERRRRWKQAVLVVALVKCQPKHPCGEL